MSNKRIPFFCSKCHCERPHRPEWRQQKKDWKTWRLYIRCTVCERLRQCPKEFHEQAMIPKPDVSNQMDMFPES